MSSCVTVCHCVPLCLQLDELRARDAARARGDDAASLVPESDTEVSGDGWMTCHIQDRLP